MAQRFRETLWFKKGASLGEPVTHTDTDGPSLGELPVEDRYDDDGTVTSDDTKAFGLHTNTTGPIAIVRTKTKRKP